MMVFYFTCSLSCYTVPDPTVMISSNPPNPIPPFGSQDVTLTCAVELSPAVDVPVTVNTVWTDQDGHTTTRTAQPVMGSSVTTFMISSFGRSDFGLYVCSATVSLTSSYAYISDSSTVTRSIRVTNGN